MRVAISVALCVFGSVMLLAFALPTLPKHLPEGDDDTVDRQALVAVCSACHPLNLVTDEVRSFDDWRATVEVMVAHGAKGTDEQFRRIDNFLYLSLTAINVNTADPEDLAAILGISDAAALAIVARRSTARFNSIVDLAKVAGVSPALLQARAERIGF